ncbi:type II toxin-antitoxin system RelE/ParE family toxin [Rhizobium sp. AG855]|uniref:type II toxin-antitoxin system RelE/ParE family toxin n=1 Tax=Rhizobium sp. AG855 TaxID=2183898 RepID=UPI000E71C59C|nr:type II toxin-antitoxin system RelE/ParE family toxin [Rhizobium sp. AG855]RKE85827.1 plasmid stabilization system protein ParE [Rhizobium sp. AG855]
MSRYLFHPIADAAQDEIFRSTRERWGQGQAETYIYGLHAHLELLAASRGLWRALPNRMGILIHSKVTIYVSRYRMHYIFFRELPTGAMGILMLVNVRRDMPKKLRVELTRIARDAIK